MPMKVQIRNTTLINQKYPERITLQDTLKKDSHKYSPIALSHKILLINKGREKDT